MRDVIQEIIPNKLTDNIDNNIKLIKRKLSIYNLKNESNYKLEDLGINIIYNRFKDITSIFYNYKELNEYFDSDKIDIFKYNYLKIEKFFKNIFKECEIFENKDFPDSIYLFKDGRFVLEQDFKNKVFWLSELLIWSKIQLVFDYSWLEISNLSNSILEKIFKEGGFITRYNYNISSFQLEQVFKQRGFTTQHEQGIKQYELDQSFKRKIKKF